MGPLNKQVIVSPHHPTRANQTGIVIELGRVDWLIKFSDGTDLIPIKYIAGMRAQ